MRRASEEVGALPRRYIGAHRGDDDDREQQPLATPYRPDQILEIGGSRGGWIGRTAGEIAAAKDLKGARFALWKNPENLTDRQQAKLASVQKTNARLYRAYLLKEQLRRIYRLQPQPAIKLLDGWIAWARRCRLGPFVKLAKTITTQRAGIIAAIEHGLSNECVSNCTSWWGCGGDVPGDGAGAMMTGGGDGVARPASAAVSGSVLAGVVEVGAAAVDPLAGDVPLVLPALDGGGRDAELRGDLLERDQPLGAESLVVGGDAAVAAQLGERGDGEWLAPSAGRTYSGGLSFWAGIPGAKA